GLGLPDQRRPQRLGETPRPGRRARSPPGGRRHRGAAPVTGAGRAVAPDHARRCSTVIWDVGGTLVDRGVGPMEAVARALGAVGLRLDAIEPTTLESARQQYLRTEPHWSTPEEERQGFEAIAAIFLSGSDK